MLKFQLIFWRFSSL